MPPRAHRLWTIGYEGHSPESLTILLREAGVQRLVDVRELPLSRKAGFSKSALAAGMQRAGIEYTHLKALGTPRAMRHEYKASGDAEAFRRAYLEHLRALPEAIAQLEALARKERVCLLCVERAWEECHRGVLAGELARRGYHVRHL